MKRPRWLRGQGGPSPSGDGTDEATLRSERARRERQRAQRRLAAMAGPSTEAEKEEAASEPKPKAPERSEAAGEPRAEEPEPAPIPKREARPKSKPKPKPARKAKAKSKQTPEARVKSKGRSREGGESPRARTLAAAGSAVRRGVTATRGRTKGAPSRIGRTVLAALGSVYAIFFDLVGFALNLLIAAAFFLAGPIRTAVATTRSAIRWVARAVTPARVLTLVVVAAALLLALSQFADYRSISVGTDAYEAVETVAPAPDRERDEAGSAHSYVMVPVAIAALILLGFTVAGRRWRLCRLIAFAGLLAILVALLVDRPAGLDVGELDLRYDGVEAQLLGGFYAQIFAGALLAASALLLGRELRLAGAVTPARRRPRDARRGLLRRAAKPQGAGA